MEKKDIKTEKDLVSYALGVNIGLNLKDQGLDELNVEAIAQAITDVFKENEFLVDAKKGGQALNQYFQELQKKKTGKNQEEGEKFLNENSKKAGVVTLPSGLQYQVIKEGSGPKPKATDEVTTHYHGTLINGTVFDSSVDRGSPATFPVNGVIQGWVEALQLMNTGSKWRLFVPSELAYGNREVSEIIGPNSTLIFDVELIKIN